MTVTELHPAEPPEERGGRVPPQDLAAERSVLGACVLSATAVDECVDLGLRATDFYRPAHELVWEAIRRLHDAREPVDAITVANELNVRGLLARVGGPAALHDLIASTPTASNAAYYARIVREQATLRGLTKAGGRIQELGFASSDGDVDDRVNQAAAALAQVADERHAGRARSLSDIADRALEQIEEGVQATPTPWRDLNDVIDGFKPGRFYVTGARPGVGKTVFALQAAVDFARRHRNDGLQAVYMTFEMSEERLYARALSMASEVSERKMRRGGLSDAEWRKIMEADDPLRGLPLVLIGASGWTPQQIRAKARQIHRSQPIGLLTIDHIGLTQPERRRDNRQAELSEAADIALATAHDLNAAVHALTQLNRGVTQRQDQRPVPSDIRDTDRLEQNGDAVMLLHRDKDKKPSEMHVGVAKHRDGEEASCRLFFDGARATISDWQWRPTDAAR